MSHKLERTYTDQQLIDAASDPDVFSWADLAKRLGLSKPNASLQKHARSLGLDPTGRTVTGAWTDDAWFKKHLRPNHYVRSTDVRWRLVRVGIWKEHCHVCGLSEWLDKPLPLEVDHINGEHTDNRLENLRLMCGNCHSQTPTFKGHNTARRRKQREVELVNGSR